MKTLLTKAGRLALFALLTATTQLSAQTPQPESARKIFEAYTGAYFQEKIFIHQDKDSYIGGETMWFKLYRVDGTSHSPNFYSGVIYVDLRDPENRLMSRMLVVRKDSCFQATYHIPPDVTSGYYTMVAYTNWMQNFSEDFYFTKRFYIHNPLDQTVLSEVEYKPDFEKRRITATFRFADMEDKPYAGEVFDIVPVVNGRSLEAVVRRANSNGRFQAELPMDSMITDMNVMFNRNVPIKYSRNFKLPIFDEKFDMQFMPEGGHLLSGVAQNVAFKAVTSNGRAVETKGTVSDNLGNLVAEFSSTHKGMGRFQMQAQAGVHYTARVTTADGRSMDVSLPEVATDGIGINAIVRPNALTCRVMATEGFNYEGLNLVVQFRGKVLMWVPIEGAASFRVPVEALPEGIAHCFIVDNMGQVYSERLILVNRDESKGIHVSGIKNLYRRREKVEALIDVSELKVGQYAEMSVSVTDTRRALAEKTDDIVSYLTLSSDIKGEVEEPWYYFDTAIDANTRTYYADLLMMTQAWRRFDLGGIFRGETPQTTFSVELGQSISGKMRPLLNEAKGLDNPMLTLLAPQLNIVRMIKPDPDGAFFIDDISFPNTTIFRVEGTQNGGKRRAAVTIDKQEFRPYDILRSDRSVFIPIKDTILETETQTAYDFYKASNPKFIYNAQGEKIYTIDDIEITARRRLLSRDFTEERFDSFAAASATPKDILQSGLYFTLRDWLVAQSSTTIVGDDPGAEFSDDLVQGETSASVREEMERVEVVTEFTETTGSGDDEGIAAAPVFDIVDRTGVYINGMATSFLLNELPLHQHANQYTTYDLLNMPMSMIEKVWVVYNRNDVMVGEENAGREGERPVVNVRTKNLSGVFKIPTVSEFEFYRLGYNIPEKFYEPVYGKPDDSPLLDERVTVHWDPYITTGPDGKATISFYMTDVPSNYRMVVQGITSVGKPFYKELPLRLVN